MKYSLSKDGLLTIPEGVESVRSEAYKNRKDLKKIVFPKSLRLIGKRAFQGCSNLEEIKLEDGLLHINDFAFSDCWSLTGVTLPETLVRIGHHAFYRCKMAGDFHLGKNLKSVKATSFACCSGITAYIVDRENPYFQSLNGVLYSKDGEKLLAYPCGREDRKYELPSATKEVADYAFQGNDYLVSVKFSDGLRKIGESAFQYCTALQAVSIPSSVRVMGKLAFYDCMKIKQVRFQGSCLEWRNLTNGLNTFHWKAGTRVYASDSSFLHC